MTQNTKQLGTAPVGRLLVRLAIPTVLAQLINMLYNIVDRIYIGHIADVGNLALTGLGVCMPVILLISAFSALIGYGGSPLASISLGKGDRDHAEHILGNSATMILLLGFILTLLFQLFAEPLLRFFGGSDATLPFALPYLRIYVIGTLPVMISLGLNSFITSQGFARTGMLTVLIGAVLNISLDPLFIFVFRMGVRGAAYATVFSQCVSALFVLFFLLGKKTTLRLQRKHLRLSAKIVLPMLALGVSPFIMQSTESLLNIAFNTSLRTYGGDLAVGCMTIFSSIMMLLTLPLMGLAQGAQPIVSYNYGAGNTDRVRRAVRLLIAVSVTYSTLFWLAVQLFPGSFIRLFNDDPSLVEMATWALRIYMGAGFLMSLQFSCQQTFLALGQAKTSLILALLRKIILLIPLIYILPRIVSDPLFAVFLAEPVADTLAVAATCILFFFTFRKLMSSPPQKETAGKGRP